MKYFYGLLLAFAVMLVPTFASAETFDEITTGKNYLTTTNGFVVTTSEFFRAQVGDSFGKDVVYIYGTNGNNSVFHSWKTSDGVTYSLVREFISPYVTSEASLFQTATFDIVDKAGTGFFFVTQVAEPEPIPEPEPTPEPIRGIQAVEMVPQTMVQNLMKILPVGLVIFSVLLGVYLIRRVIYSFI